ncbi:MAG: YraN family protein [Alphaproteobacteria bacterium]|nr:YraN family protein [Alphaproteobacteria bacterium]
MRAWLETYHRQGYLAEFLAAWTLRLKGYRILKYRYKTAVGEIDLIASRGSTLVAVEVKYRLNLQQALEAISFRQQKRIEMALSLYLRHLPWTPENIRFDPVLLIPYKWPKHIMNAWFTGD